MPKVSTASRIPSMNAKMSSAMQGFPSWKVAPSRILNCQWRPSGGAGEVEHFADVFAQAMASAQRTERERASNAGIARAQEAGYDVSQNADTLMRIYEAAAK